MDIGSHIQKTEKELKVLFCKLGFDETSTERAVGEIDSLVQKDFFLSIMEALSMEEQKKIETSIEKAEGDSALMQKAFTDVLRARFNEEECVGKYLPSFKKILNVYIMKLHDNLPKEKQKFTEEYLKEMML